MKKFVFIFPLIIISSILGIQLSSAQIMFQRHYGGIGDDGASCVIQTSDEGYLISGHTSSYGNGGWDVYLIKTDNYGDTMWTKTYGGFGDERGSSICQTVDGGYAITGGSNSYGAGSVDVYLIKINAEGDTMWTRTYGGTEDDDGYNIYLCSDGGFAIVGVTMSFSSGIASIYLIRTNSDGEKLWEKTYEKLYDNSASGFIETEDKGFLISGNTMNPYSDENKIWLIKTDSVGDTIWTKLYQIPNYKLIGCSVDLTEDNGYITAGSAEDSAGNVNVYILKTNEHGELVWSRIYHEDTEERASCIRKTNDNNYIVCGFKGNIYKYFIAPGIYSYLYANSIDLSLNEKANNSDVLLMKINSDGEVIWTRTFGGSRSDWSVRCAQTIDNGCIISGYTYSYTTSNLDAYLIKTDANGYSNISNELTVDKVLLYPNPSDGEIHISLPENIDEMHVCQVYNILGELVYSNKFTSENLSLNIPYPGIYVIKIEGETVNISRKIIIY